LNNIHVVKNCFVVVPSLLSQLWVTGTTLWASFLSPSECSLPTISAMLMMHYIHISACIETINALTALI